jgi:hypothetical protein
MALGAGRERLGASAPHHPDAQVEPGNEVNQMAALLPLIPMAAPLVGMTALAAVFVRVLGRSTPPPPPTPDWGIG